MPAQEALRRCRARVALGTPARGSASAFTRTACLRTLCRRLDAREPTRIARRAADGAPLRRLTIAARRPSPRRRRMADDAPAIICRRDRAPARAPGRATRSATRRSACGSRWRGLPQLPARGVALNRRGLVAFHERDHGARDGTPLSAVVAGLLAREGIVADGDVVLHAFPRMLGYVFNPVSFWVCHDRAGAVVAVLAEVQQHVRRAAPLPARASGWPRARFRRDADRAQGVPRVAVLRGARAITPSGSISAPTAGSRASTTSTTTRRSGALLETWISGTPQPLDRAAVRGLLWRYRWFTLGVIARIHWQARGCGSSACRSSRKPRRRAAVTPIDRRIRRGTRVRSSARRARRPARAQACRGPRPMPHRCACARAAAAAFARQPDTRRRPTAHACVRQRGCRRRADRGARPSTTGTSPPTALNGGDVGFAEAYIDGRWDTPDLDAAAHAARRRTSRRSSACSTAARGARAAALQARAHANTRRAARSATSSRTTTSATRSTRCGSTRR